MNNKKVAAGLNGILNPTPAQETKQEQAKQLVKKYTEEPEKTKGDYKTVCYSIPPEVAEKIRYIAWYDRKKINAVVSEAFEEYAARWAKANPEAKK